MKNVIDVCPHCGNVNPIPSFDGMVADRCEPCVLSFDETKAKYGLGTALYYQFLQSMDRAKETLTQDSIEELINLALTSSDNRMALTRDIYLVINDNGLGTFQAVVHYLPSVGNDIVVFTCTYTAKQRPGVKRPAERITSKIKKWKPGIIFEATLEAAFKLSVSVQAERILDTKLYRERMDRTIAEERILALPIWKRTVKNLKKIFR